MSKVFNMGTFSEDFTSTTVMFNESDIREFFYATNDYRPASLKAPIVWQDLRSSIYGVPDMIDKGAKVVTKEIAQMIMSFDPYGVEVYPVKLILRDGTLEDRYILSTKNIIDVIDMENSLIEGGCVVYALYISAEKLSKIPLYKRLVFRVKGDDGTVFFNWSILDYLIEYFNEHGASGIQITPFNTSVEAPIV